MTCPTCGNAHTGECSVAALKARIERLDHRVGVLNTRERMVLDELGFAEDVSPVWGAVLLNIRDLRGRVKVGEAERDALRAQIADLEAKADPRIADLVAKVRAGAGTPDDLRVLCDVAERVGLMSAMIEEKDEALADRQRLLDLVRHQRGPLHDAELISDEEYAALASDHGAVARLEGYDELRVNLAEAQATIARLNRAAH